MRRSVMLAAISAAWLGCSGGSGGEGDLSVTLTTAGSATSVTAGQTLVIQAHVTNSTTTTAVTWSLTGPMCPASCGTIVETSMDFALYTPPASVSSQFQVMVTATSTENSSKSGSVQLTVEPRACPPGSSMLSGQYAFLLQGFHQQTGDGIAAVGSITADACGLITGGSADYYFGPSAGLAGSASSLGGSYTVGADRRGTLTVAVGPSTMHMAMALGVVSGGVATKGAVVVSDGGSVPVLSGVMFRQDPASFAQSAITGPYAFVLNGWNGTAPREALGSTVTASGTGALTGGALDDMVFESSGPVTTDSWTGACGAPSGSGRSAVIAPALTGPNGHAVMYVVSASHMLLMVSDTTLPGRVLSGRMLRQAGPFDLTSLDGTCVTFQAANYWTDLAPGSYTNLNTSVLALFAADGAGHLSATSVDQSFGGNNYFADTSTGLNVHYTYEVSADGQANILVAPGTSGGTWYLLGQNTALMLGFDVGVSVGQILPQAGAPFSAASIGGDYLVSQAPGAASGSAHSAGIATSAGNGMLGTVLDVSRLGVFTSGLAESSSVTVAPNGRATDITGHVIYVVSPSLFLRTNQGTFDEASWYPVIQVFDR